MPTRNKLVYLSPAAHDFDEIVIILSCQGGGEICPSGLFDYEGQDRSAPGFSADGAAAAGSYTGRCRFSQTGPHPDLYSDP